MSTHDEVPSEESIFDIGPETVTEYGSVLSSARTVFWNGPMGVFENPEFANGTLGIARAIAASDAFSVIGGGDSLAAIEQSGVADQIDHLSTGGGASLEFLEGATLPGVAALDQAEDLVNRTPLIAGNWKMNTSRNEALALASELAATAVPGVLESSFSLPSSGWKHSLAQYPGPRCRWVVRTVRLSCRGAYTGQISASMLAELCSWVIVGHSERRRDFGESNELVGRKAAAAVICRIEDPSSALENRSMLERLTSRSELSALRSKLCSVRCPGLTRQRSYLRMNRSGRSAQGGRRPRRMLSEWPISFAGESLISLVRKPEYSMAGAWSRKMPLRFSSSRMWTDCWSAARV